MTTRTILLTGARGGHGTTTVAAALALNASEHGPTELRTDVASTAALVGAATPVADDTFEITDNLVLTSHTAVLDHPSPHTRVIDAGPAHSAAHTPPADEYYIVLRGPCYVALATLLAAADDRPDDGRPDGIILVAEPKRSLTARDVTDVLDVPVIATIAVTPDVARTIDAGLLISRLHRLREFAPLRALATDPFAGRLRPSTVHPRQQHSNPSKTHTDLPLSISIAALSGRAGVKRVAHSAARLYVDGMWIHTRRSTHVEHRKARTWRGGLLHR